MKISKYFSNYKNNVTTANLVKITKYKLQNTNNFQFIIPINIGTISETCCVNLPFLLFEFFKHWNLGFICYLFFAIWNLLNIKIFSRPLK